MQYVGQTINPDDRFKQHVIDAKNRKSNSRLYNAIRKYNENNFEYTIIEDNIPLDDINEKEIYWIAHLNTLMPNGYNMTIGGEGTFGYKHTEEDKQKMSRLKKGKFTHFQTQETRRKISLANKGRKPSLKSIQRLKDKLIGVPLTETHKKNMSKALKGKKKSASHNVALHNYWDNLTEDQMSKRTQHLLEARCMKVSMLDKSTHETVMCFESMRKAAEWIRENTSNKKASHTRISFVCGDINKRAYGYKWDYTERCND